MCMQRWSARDSGLAHSTELRIVPTFRATSIGLFLVYVAAVTGIWWSGLLDRAKKGANSSSNFNDALECACKYSHRELAPQVLAG